MSMHTNTTPGPTPTPPAPDSSRRRGTILLLVVGVLALLSIIAVVYTAIGRGDRLTSNSYQRDNAMKDFVNRLGEYQAQIIADDVFDTVRVGGPSQPINVREGWDAPSVPDEVFVAPNGSGTFFNPTGEIRTVNGSTQVKSGGTDPWLASTEPRLPPPGTAGNGMWPSISVMAPDGKFVNLVNLRGNFDAKPGVEPGDLNYGVARTEADGRTTTFGASPDVLENPHNWAVNQYGAFSPPDEPPLNAGGYPPGQREYRLNNWADADGDGFRDARWWIPVDSTDPNNIRTIVPYSGNYRIVVATRIVDLSGLVNVNTATQFRQPPLGYATQQYGGTALAVSAPAGLTPADVDLRRLLTLDDAYYANGGNAYNAIDEQNTRIGLPQEEQFTQYNRANAYMIGDVAYQSIQDAISNGAVAPGDYSYTPLSRQYADAFARRGHYASYTAGVMGGLWSTSAGTSRFTVTSPFDLGTELELRTYSGANDPDNTSRLEAAVAGRETSQPFYDPLRSTRSLELERGRVDVPANPGALPDGKAEIGALTQAKTDVRHLLTTASAVRPLFSYMDMNSTAVNPLPDPNQLKPAEVRADPITESRSGATTLSASGVKAAFNGLFNALAPFTTPANWDVTAQADQRTLAYGDSPELALHTAAHMLANLLDAQDDDDNPTAFSVEVSPVGSPPADARDAPFTKLSPTREPSDPNTLRAAANFNVFGIEPQPFITEADSFIIYTDKPHSGSGFNDGDDEFADSVDTNGDGQIDQYAEITIRGAVNASNSDFITEIIAFQLSNPFQQTITISDADRPYYIEYGGRFYDLANGEQIGAVSGSGQSDQITLAPGQSRVFFTLSFRSLSDVNSRFATGLDGAPSSVAYTGPTDYIQSIVRAQFGDNAVFVKPFSPAGQVPQRDMFDTALGVYDLHGDNLPNSSDDLRREVMLWRHSSPNIANAPDQLIDRLRDSNASSTGLRLRGALPSGNTMVPRTRAGDDHASNPIDNTGFSIFIWRGFRRPDWSGASKPIGAVPPWALEVKRDADTSLYSRSLNTSAQSSTGVGTRPDYGIGSESYFLSLGSLLGHYIDGSNHPDGVEIYEKPDSKSGNGIGMNGSGKTFLSQAIELHMNCSGNRNPGLLLRPADLLLAPAVGPTYAPVLPGIPSGNRAADLDRQWTTLGESIALAMDYYSPANPNALYYRAGSSAGGAQPKFDRGHLVIDGYVPFIDANHNLKFDQGDAPAGLGIPLALNILDRFRTDDYGDLTHAQPGRININTAPLSVLRTLPMLSPTTMPTGEWWGGLRNSQIQNLDANDDIAATLMAYRERADPNFASSADLEPIESRDRSVVFDFFTRPSGTPDSGRSLATKVSGLRPPNPPGSPATIFDLDSPGFLSVGEVLLARDEIHDPNHLHAIDRLGRDNVSIDNDGVDPTRYKRVAGSLGPADPSASRDDGIADDYDEKLAIADAVLNTISVRSDTFCVWFVIQGYLPSDVEGLDDNDPMVPSIARRYVMVVDRSNVVKRGDKPRILLFQEVPM